MAKINFENISFKKRFFGAFIIIYALTAIVSFSLLLVSNNIVSGINFFSSENISDIFFKDEISVPVISDSIDNMKEKVFTERKKFEDIIKNEGFSFQVTDLNGKYIYGDLKKSIISNSTSMLKSLNKTERSDLNINSDSIRSRVFLPVINSKNKLAGCVILESKADIKINAASFRLVDILNITKMFLPVIFMIIMTIIFTKIFFKQLEKPLKELKEASVKIGNKDLDFEMKYKNNNELGILCDSFEEMKNELKVSLEKQWKLEIERKEMIKVLAHDLKTPVSVINGHSEYLIDYGMKNEEKSRRYLEIINKNGKKISEMVSEINYVSEIENTDFELKYSEVDIEEYLDEKEKEFNMLCGKKDIRFIMKRSYEDKTKKIFRIDVQRLDRIINNIMSNALRYTIEAKNIFMYVKIEINNVYFTIQDEGKGFSHEAVNKGFEKFYKNSESILEKGHCGLGLYVCKMLTEKHCGRIKLYNSKNGGGVVEFYIQENID